VPQALLRLLQGAARRAPQPFLHPLALTRLCLRAQCDWHAGVRCEHRASSADEAAFRAAARKGRFKTCPRCRVWVEKADGCDNMVCRCGATFCYRCGKHLQRSHGARACARCCWRGRSALAPALTSLPPRLRAAAAMRAAAHTCFHAGNRGGAFYRRSY
jgi:hypothetical protein